MSFINIEYDYFLTKTKYIFRYELGGMIMIPIRISIHRYIMYIHLPNKLIRLNIDTLNKIKIIKLINEVCFDHFEY